MKTNIEMAREAGVRDDGHRFEFSEYKYLERFAELVRADERQALAQPQRPWVGLTDEERNIVLDSVSPDNLGGEYYNKEITAIALAIEAKLKEKNNAV